MITIADDTLKGMQLLVDYVEERKLLAMPCSLSCVNNYIRMSGSEIDLKCEVCADFVRASPLECGCVEFGCETAIRRVRHYLLIERQHRNRLKRG